MQERTETGRESKLAGRNRIWQKRKLAERNRNPEGRETSKTGIQQNEKGEETGKHMDQKNATWECTCKDDRYPRRLLPYGDMPKKLYVRGSLPEDHLPSAAIVGARNCSRYGEKQAYLFARELADCGVQIISGLARGIDRSAHKGALDAGGKAFAVLGCGVDICYPVQNRQEYMKIWETGGLLSEFEPGTPPYGRNFPRRNRIISGLADLVLVIEAKERSGSLITAGFATDQGKPVYALPGRVGDLLSEGCNKLIADGAGVAYCVDILLDELKIQRFSKKDFPSNSQIRLASQEEMVYSCLDLQPKNIEEIFQAVPLEMKQIMEILLKLELEGLVEEPVKNYYARAGG